VHCAHADFLSNVPVTDALRFLLPKPPRNFPGAASSLLTVSVSQVPVADDYRLWMGRGEPFSNSLNKIVHVLLGDGEVVLVHCRLLRGTRCWISRRTKCEALRAVQPVRDPLLDTATCKVRGTSRGTARTRSIIGYRDVQGAGCLAAEAFYKIHSGKKNHIWVCARLFMEQLAQTIASASGTFSLSFHSWAACLAP
jgi:hypothetical protein